MALRLRGKKWYFVKRVPKVYREIEGRDQVWVSLKTEDRRLAERKVFDVEEALEAKWKAKALGGDDPERFELLVKLAARNGFSYKPLEKLWREDSMDAVVERMETAGTQKDQEVYDALLGVGKGPAIRVSSLIEQWKIVNKIAWEKKKGDEQRRQWESAHQRALDYFIQVNGDIEVTKLERGHAIAWHDWFEMCIAEERMKCNTANTYMARFKGLLKAYYKRYKIQDPRLFSDMRFPDDTAQRLTIPYQHCVEYFTAEKLAGMNDELTAIIHIMMNTGARVSEIARLAPEDIVLDDEYPHIFIRENEEGDKKNKASVRKMILIGRALEACKKFPEGFPRYRKKVTNVSSSSKKYLKENGLLPSDDHSIYGMRHGFSDLLLTVTKQDREIADLMGHEIKRERYGDGLSLADKHRILSSLLV